MGETRTIGRLVGAFAAIALLLAAVGLYGVVSYAASQRARELGIRVALGARPETLTRLLITKGLVISVAGLLIGLGVSYAIGRALGSLLFGVGATDALMLGMASAALLGTAALATWIPAYRASRVDAVVSLRG